MHEREFWRRWAVAISVVGVLTLAVAGCAGTSEGEGGSGERPAAAKTTSKPAKDGSTLRHRTVEKRESIPFASQTRKSAELKKGVRRVTQPGRAGVRVKVWRVTTTDGKTTGRKLLKSTVVRKPVQRITVVGTYVAPPPPKSNCDSNYSGCVPISSDVDCGGGSGNGPAYVYGSVQVVGSDIYGLDADGDGWGCD